MTARLFGTDGVRGLANGDVLTPELALAVARSAAHELLRAAPPGAAVRCAVIGRDTRPSGPMLEAAAAAGFASAGVDVQLLGVVPTPVVAHACARGGADLGLVVSASHNAMPDNGLKLFGPGGWKLPDEVEVALERGPRRRPRAPDRARARPHHDRHLGRRGLRRAACSRRCPRPPPGCKVVVDCAQGAASVLAPEVYRRAGAEVVAIAADGDGARINDGSGATHLELLQAAVLEHGADLGLAHDGDADRCLAVDASGAVVDGDQLLALLAVGPGRARHAAHRHRRRDRHEQPRLRPGDDRARHRRRRRPPWATATCSRRCGPAGTRSAASSRATRCSSTTRPRATAC